MGLSIREDGVEVHVWMVAIRCALGMEYPTPPIR